MGCGHPVVGRRGWHGGEVWHVEHGAPLDAFSDAGQLVPQRPLRGPANIFLALDVFGVDPGQLHFSSATPCATAHGAHSSMSTTAPRPAGSLRVITARWSHTPMSSGWVAAQEHSQSCRPQTAAIGQLSSTARTAGSLVSLWNASAVTVAVRSAHSAATAATTRHAAANSRIGLSPPLISISSHLGGAVTSALTAGYGFTGITVIIDADRFGVAGHVRQERRSARHGAGQPLTKMSSGRNADTSMFGASTTWLIFRSTATLQMA
jgi:hypothetical protein